MTANGNQGGIQGYVAQGSLSVYADLHAFAGKSCCPAPVWKRQVFGQH